MTGGVTANPAASGDNNVELREYLRDWRRTTASEQGIAAFVIMHDTSLEELCRRQPLSVSELRRVPGFGDRKTELYGAAILEALSRFKNGARSSGATSTVAPSEETARLLGEGKTFEEIANIRGRQVSSVVSLAADLVERGEIEFQPGWILEGHQRLIEEACRRLGTGRLKFLKDALPETVSYGEIRLVIANLRQQRFD
jgi:ATP-dependent DNA helicase RecQ